MSSSNDSDSGCLSWIILFFVLLGMCNRIDDLESDVQGLKQDVRRIDRVEQDTIPVDTTYYYYYEDQ